jgi:hypothetical protein
MAKGTTLTVTSNQRTLRRNTKFLRNVVLTRATRRNIQQDDILHSHRRENLKSYKGTSYEYPHYAVFSTLPSLHPSLVQIYSLAPCSQTPSVYVAPLMSETMFRRAKTTRLHFLFLTLLEIRREAESSLTLLGPSVGNEAASEMFQPQRASWGHNRCFSHSVPHRATTDVSATARLTEPQQMFHPQRASPSQNNYFGHSTPQKLKRHFSSIHHRARRNV